MPTINLNSGSRNLLTVSGSAGTGKTTYALVWAAMKSARDGKKIVVFSDDTDRREYENFFHACFGLTPTFVDEFHYTEYGRLNWQYLLQHYCENFKEDLAIVIDCQSMADSHRQIVNKMIQKGIEVCVTQYTIQSAPKPEKVIKGYTDQSYSTGDNR